MFAKLAVVVLSCGTIAAALLAQRHAHVQAQSELTQAQLRINKQDERLWMLRTKIGERITPYQVESLSAGIVPLHPIDPYVAWDPNRIQQLAEASQP